MKNLMDRRQARNPVQEGISMLPYLVVYQRLHRRRWTRGLLAAAVTLAGLWLIARKR